MRNSEPSMRKMALSAFTLIELLVVVTIISILASIAVPNFLDAQIRAKVSRVKNDLRALSVAVETYRIDNNQYPYRRNGNATIDTNYKGADGYPWLKTYPLPEKKNNQNPHVQLSQMSILTTPHSYITSIPTDIFDKLSPSPNNCLDYWDPTQTLWFINNNLSSPYTLDRAFWLKNPGDVGYMLVSVGPDGYIGTGNSLTGEYQGWPTNYDLAGSMKFTYDPSNGTISGGNIYFAPQIGTLDQVGTNLTKKMNPE